MKHQFWPRWHRAREDSTTGMMPTIVSGPRNIYFWSHCIIVRLHKYTIEGEEGRSCSYNDLRLDGDTNSGFGSSSANSHSSVMDLLKHCCYFLFSAFLLTSPTQYWTMKAARKHESRIIHSSINVTTQPQPICYVVLWIIRAGFLGKRKTLTHYKRLSLT